MDLFVKRGGGWLQTVEASLGENSGLRETNGPLELKKKLFKGV